MKNETSVMAILAAALGALCSYASALVVPLAVLIAVMLADYASGMAKAWSAGKLCSKTGLRGILKKLGYLVLVGVAGVVDWLVRYGLTQVGVEVSFQFLMATMVIVWLIINELISILENVAALGGPVPGFLRKLLTRLKATVETKAGEGADACPCFCHRKKIRSGKRGVFSMEFLSYLISGISLGSVYAIIALGYTMVYGIAKMLNFAHGDVIMVGGYISFCAMFYLGLPNIVAVLLAVVVCTVLGIVIERLAYKPLRSAPSLAVLITAIGVSYFLQNSALLIWKAAARVYPPVVEGTASLFGGQLSISYISLLTIAVCVVIMLALTTFVNKSKMGKAMRACSEDKAAAQLMGINVNSTISATFAIGSALAAIAGVLLCSFNTSLMPTTGSMPGIKAFTAAVFGGIGSIPGAFLGGLLLGIIEALAKAYISTQLANSIVFAVLIVVLLVKPAGLLGKIVPEKV